MGHRGRAGDGAGSAGRVAQRLLLALALAGLVLLAWRRRWEAIAFAIPIATITAIAAISLAANRRNEILMTLVIPLAATAASEGVDRIRSRREGTGRRSAPAHSGARA